MNKDNNLIKKFKEKVEELKKHNILYFNQDKPIISDAEYDNLKKELIRIEKFQLTLEKHNMKRWNQKDFYNYWKCDDKFVAKIKY